MNMLNQGLMISVLGMGITFSTLAVLIFLIHMLRLIFPAQKQLPIKGQTSLADKEEGERRVAIFAALWFHELDQHQSSELGRRLEQPRSSWSPPKINRPRGTPE